jgi:hypothetical protein
MNLIFSLWIFNIQILIIPFAFKLDYAIIGVSDDPKTLKPLKELKKIIICVI